MEIRELISKTISCPKCNGAGKIKVDDKETECSNCRASGIVIDSTIPDTIKEYAEISNGNLAKCVEEIYSKFGDKLEDAYKRGVEDGKSQAKETK